MRAESIERQILAERAELAARPKIETPTCFSCGREFTYRGPQGDDSGRFCHPRCREWYDAGNPPYAPPKPPYDMSLGPEGFYIDCPACSRRFESKGLRCCSTTCERATCNHEDGKAHGCQFCGSRIPKGRSRAKFCSDDCGAAKRRLTRNLALGDRQGVNGAIRGEIRELSQCFGAADFPFNALGGYQFEGAHDPGLWPRRKLTGLETWAKDGDPNYVAPLASELQDEKSDPCPRQVVVGPPHVFPTLTKRNHVVALPAER